MDWNKKELDFLTRAADVFDLPADVIGSLPHIELIGDCQLLLSGHQGILSYSTEAIDINGGEAGCAPCRRGAGADGHERQRAAGEGEDHTGGAGAIGGGEGCSNRW